MTRTVREEPLSKEAHKQNQTAVAKLLWLALIHGDISYASKELSRRDVIAPTEQSLAKLKHLLRHLSGTRQAVLRLRPRFKSLVPSDLQLEGMRSEHESEAIALHALRER